MPISAVPKRRSPGHSDSPLPRLLAIGVTGFKSICANANIPLRPITLLAGANSSGKSSFFQPLLLLKQTLESRQEPAGLLLSGPYITFSQVDQLFWNSCASGMAPQFKLDLNVEEFEPISLTYERGDSTSPRLKARWGRVDLIEGTYPLQADIREAYPHAFDSFEKANGTQIPWLQTVTFERSVPRVVVSPKTDDPNDADGYDVTPKSILRACSVIESVIHVAGLRRPPQREYPSTAAVSGKRFPGPFEAYTASLLKSWQSDPSRGKLVNVEKDLLALGLTSRIETQPIDDVSVELRVGRTLISSRGKGPDLVNIADVGLGVSQVLPVLVALHVAAPNQIVILEQPEIHLHPRAQLALAGALVAAAKRGVLVVVETHSSHLLLAIQTAVARCEIDPSKVSLNWFRRDDSGATTVATAELQSDGSYGDWPEDFGDVTLDAEREYLDATPTAP
ncbi:MAG: AAA family ATPase [Planctomycetota bacterium]|nr:AAA family ATPase [Planctomycetota bacterium]